MKLSGYALGLATYAAAAAAAAVPIVEDSTQAILLPLEDSRSSASIGAPDKFLIELAPGVTTWVVEEEKWALKRKGINFMDVTGYESLGQARLLSSHRASSEVSFPSKPSHSGAIRPLLEKLDKSNLRSNLEQFSSFYTRYYQSSSGTESGAWLAGRVNATLATATDLADKIGISLFEHSWDQPSIIATIPGKSDKIVVIGAHQDSINLFLPALLPAPGADDDGSGTVTILEALRVLLTADTINGTEGATQFENTIEFHWYSAEEGGLLGSQAIFSKYSAEKKDVKAMLQQDMTGYVKGTLSSGKPEAVGVITDYVDPGLTEFIKKVIDEYCDIPYVETKCGYACSDHASASKAGYPAAFVIESTFADSQQKIHTTGDTIDELSFDHMLQHAKMTLALVYELGMHKFD